jgi:hypothetical protein
VLNFVSQIGHATAAYRFEEGKFFSDSLKNWIPRPDAFFVIFNSHGWVLVQVLGPPR